MNAEILAHAIFVYVSIPPRFAGGERKKLTAIKIPLVSSFAPEQVDTHWG